MRRILLVGNNISFDSLDRTGDTTVITPFFSVYTKLNDGRTIFLHRLAQDKLWPSIVQSTKKWLEEWHRRRISNDGTILDLLSFEDSSYWWFVYDDLVEATGGVFDAIYYSKTIAALIESIRPDIIEVLGEFDYPMNTLLKILNEKYCLTVKYNGRLGKSNKPHPPLLPRIRYPASKILGLLNKRRYSKNVFLFTHGKYSYESNTDHFNLVNDLYLEGLEDYLVKNSRDATFISLNLPRLRKNIIGDVVNDAINILKGTYIPWMKYYELGDFQEWKRTFKEYTGNFHSLELEGNLKESFVMDGNNLYPLVQKMMIDFLPTRIADAKVAMRICDRFVGKDNPQVVFNVEGLNLFGKALNFTCRKYGIRSLAPQLGVISPELPVNIGLYVPAGFDLRLLPELLVWGSFYKKIIEERGYPPERIHQVGFWKRGKTSMVQQKDKIVLYIAGANVGRATYLLSIDEELITIQEIARRIPVDHRLVVKLHPSHPSKMYCDSLSDMNSVSVVEQEANRDIKSLIQEASLVVGKCSTALLEAASMGKPVIAINFGTSKDFLGINELPFVDSPESFAKTFNSMDSTIPTDNLRSYVGGTIEESIGNLTKLLGHSGN